jgi:hypothetical protein
MNVYRVGLSPEAIERTRQADEAISSQKAENALAELEARQARRVYDDAHEKAEAARLELTAV